MLTPTVNANPTTTQATQRTTDLGTRDVFLKMLVAQMQYQDPLKPQDPTKMASQLAQFNMVDQQITTNRFLEGLQSSQDQTISLINASIAMSNLGHQAVYMGDQIGFQGASVSFNFSLPADAASATVIIRDETGNIVRTLPQGALASGQAVNVSWDGSTDGGGTAPNGVYQLELQAVDTNGKPLATQFQIQGPVQAIRMTENGLQYEINGVSVNSSKISKITI